MIYAIEGLDCSGKTTLVKKIKDELTQRGKRVVVIRELSATQRGREIAEWVHGTDITANKENAIKALKLLTQAREAVFNEIIPSAILNADIIIFDRFAITTWVYQNFNDSWGMQNAVKTALHKFTKRINVNKTFVLDVDKLELQRRLKERNTNNDLTDLTDNVCVCKHYEFKNKLMQACTEVPKSLTGEIVLIDANGTINATFRKVMEMI